MIIVAASCPKHAPTSTQKSLYGTPAAAAAAIAVLLFLCTTNLIGHREVRHAYRVFSRDGDWLVFAFLLRRLHCLYQKDEGAKPGNHPNGNVLSEIGERWIEQYSKLSSVRFMPGDRSFIPELSVLPRATSRVLSIAATATSVGAPCEPTALGAGVTFLKVFCRLFVQCLAKCLAVACQQAESKSPVFKPNQAD